MELKLRKAIKNGSCKLPGFEWGSLPQFVFPEYTPTELPTGTHQFPGGGVDVSSSGVADITARLAELSAPGELSLTNPRTPEKDALSVGTKVGGSSLGDKAGGIIQSGIQLAGGLANTAKDYKTKDQFIAEAGTSTGNIGGISFQRINNIYKDGKLPKYAQGTVGGALNNMGAGAALGASIGSVIPGVGTLIGGAAGAVLGGVAGGILGHSAANKEEAEKQAAIRYRDRFNKFNQSGAMSQLLQMKEAEEGYEDGKTPTYSPFGPTGAEADSKVSSGETAVRFNSDGSIQSIYRIPGKKNNKDNKYFVGGKDPNVFIASNKYGISDLATIDPTAALYKQQLYKNAGLLKKNKGEAKNGKMPRREEGWIPNAIVSGLGGLASLKQYIDAYNQDVYRPNTYAPNTYAGRALRGLGSLRYSAQPIINNIANTNASYNYALTNSPALSSAQKYIGRTANARNMYKSISDTLTNLQERNIGLKSNYYTNMLNVGTQDAQRRMQANQWDTDYYSKAHAARQSGIQMGMQNMLNQLQSYYANDFKRRQFNDTMSMYRSDQELERQKIAQLAKYLKGI